MALEPIRIDFDSFARDPKRVFEQVRQTHQAVLVERDGELYRVERANGTDIFAGYDVGRVQEALKISAGALHGVDRDVLLRDIYEQREQSSTGRPD